MSREIQKIAAKRKKKEKDIIMTAFHTVGVQDIKYVVEQVNGDTKSFIFEGKVFLILRSWLEGSDIKFEINSTKEVLIALKLKKLIS